MELVIMAAGMGSRFGGLKQIEPVGPNGEFIIDYSIYDAIKCGFDKIVFIIKEENYDIFRETVGKRVEDKIKVEYVFQNNDNVPKDIEIPSSRVKPLGTAHAILCCKGTIKDDFAVINADDFYGYDAFRVISSFIKSKKSDNQYAMAGYKVKNTLTENGAVKRGVCVKEGNYLSSLIESSVEKTNDKIIATPLEGGEIFEVNPDDPVSMNMFALSPKFLDYTEYRFHSFLKENEENLDSCEYLLPSVIFELIRKKEITVEVLKTDAVWHGITYKEDLEDFKVSIRKLIEAGDYPENLWG